MTKVAQSSTAAMWRISCQISKNVEPETFFKQIFFCRNVFQFFFAETKTKIGTNYKERNHWHKLHGRKSCLSLR